jgi:uncharacterized protein (TIRG00374 family)
MRRNKNTNAAASLWDKKHLAIGVLISAALIYLALRGVAWQDVAASLRGVDYFYVICALLAMLVMQALRSLRWGVLLSPLVKVDQWKLFSITSVGFLAIITLPMRMGELVKPYIMAKRTNISVASAVGSALAERVFDFLSIAIFVALFPLLLPNIANLWFFNYTLVFFALFVVGAALLLLVGFNPSIARTLWRMVFGKGGKYSQKLLNILRDFIAGLRFAKDWRLALLVFAISVLVWLAEVAILYYMLLAFGVKLPFAAYLFLTAVLLAAIAVPAAPGFIGSWHYACVLGLSFFGIAGGVAFAFGVLYHLATMAFLGVLGLLFLPGNYSAVRAALAARRAASDAKT